MHGCESWTIKKAEHWRIDAFELWCWTLESPLDCTEIQPVHPNGAQFWVLMEGLMLKLKLQYFGRLMQRVDSFEKTLMMGKRAMNILPNRCIICCRRKRRNLGTTTPNGVRVILFASGGQSIGVSATASVLPMNTQDWFPLGWTGWISLQSKGLSRVFSTPQFKSINSLALSFLYSPTITSIHDNWKNHSFD